MTEESHNGIRTVTSPSSERRIGYARDFRQMLRENPGVIRAALSLSQQAEDAYNPGDIHLINKDKVDVAVFRWNRGENNWQVIETHGTRHEQPQDIGTSISTRGTYFKADKPYVDEATGLEITVLGKATRTLAPFPNPVPNRIDETSYFRMRLLDKSSQTNDDVPDFFVKKSVATKFPGFEEFVLSKRAEEELGNIPELRVVEAQLGYTDEQQSWFVSKWEDLENINFFPAKTFTDRVPNEYGGYPHEMKADFALWMDANVKVGEMIGKITDQMNAVGIDITDLEANLFYNPDTGEFFLLDVTAVSGEGLNQKSRIIKFYQEYYHSKK